MDNAAVNEGNDKKSILHYLYLTTLFFLTLTGFGQMPIFKRYYIADIPGLGWLAKFYITHYMHYLFAVLLIGIAAFFIVDYLLSSRKRVRLTPAGMIRTTVLAGLVVTGAMLVIRNLPGSGFSPEMIIFLDLAHLGLVMALLMAGLFCVVFRKKWHKPLERAL